LSMSVASLARQANSYKYEHPALILPPLSFKKDGLPRSRFNSRGVVGE